MKKTQLLRYCLSCLLVFTSYSAHSNFFVPGVDIYEDAHIYANGSGKFEIAADLSKVEQLIQVASFFAKATPEATKKSIQEACSTAAHNLEDIPGISDVATTHDTKMLHFTLSFQFSTIKALNEAVRKLYVHIDHPGSTHFRMDRHAFTRSDTTNAAQLLAHYRKKNNTQMEDLILKNILNVITYNIAYSFDRKIQRVTNALVSISENRKKIFFTQSLADACKEELSLSNKVIF